MNSREQIQDFITEAGAMPATRKLNRELKEKYPNMEQDFDFVVFANNNEPIALYRESTLQEACLELTKRILHELVHRHMDKPR